MEGRAEFLSSAQNSKIRRLKALKTRKGRMEQGLFAAEGLRLVREIVFPWELDTLLLSEEFYEKREDWKEIAGRYPAAKILCVPGEIFQTVSDTLHPQGILAAVRMREFTEAELMRSEKPFLVLLENVQDPGNAGTILRTADAAGAGGVLCSGETADFFSPKTVRSSMGSVFHLPVVRTDDFPAAVGRLKEKGVRVYAAHLEGSRSCFEADFTGSCALMIGNEGNGLSSQVSQLADERIRIPQPGRAESLNASVAAGILIYEVLRQRIAR